MEDADLIFDALHGLRQFADQSGNPDLCALVEHAENAAMEEVLNVDLQGKRLVYDKTLKRTVGSTGLLS